MVHACTEFLNAFLSVDPNLWMLTDLKIENPTLTSSRGDVVSLHVVMIQSLGIMKLLVFIKKYFV